MKISKIKKKLETCLSENPIHAKFETIKELIDGSFSLKSY